MKTIHNRLANRFYCVTALLLLATPSVYAGILSQGLCRPYRQLVDNELFLVVGLIVAAILVIAWKVAPSGSTLAKGIGLMAAIAIGLNLETLMQASFGAGVAC